MFLSLNIHNRQADVVPFPAIDVPVSVPPVVLADKLSERKAKLPQI
jgi:hypothetical protein